MKRNSIRRWYAVLVITAILFSTVVVGALGIYTLYGKTNRDVVTIMNLTTEARASELDLVLLKIKDAVDTVASYVGARVVSTNQQLDEDVMKATLAEEIQELFQSTVNNMDGVTGYYVRFADSYSELVDGFAFQRKTGEGGFEPAVEDDALSGSDSAAAEENWFDLISRSGSPVWIPIRECPYQDGYILSYAVPIYFNEELVGAACVDVDFEVLAKPVRDISLFGAGYAYLTDDKGKVYYHPLIGYGVLLTEDDDDVPEVDAALSDTSNHGKLIVYEYQGQKKSMAFKSLINEMRLVVTANEEDVERETFTLIRNIILSASIIMLLFILLALLAERSRMHPALERMDSLAHLDGLTGTQNKTSFMETQGYLDQKIREGNAVFGFVMFDANNLKKINDRYGHKMGDAYLLSIVEMIRDNFPGWQIFRVGGDEFVVLVEGEEALGSAAGCLEATYTWQSKRKKEKREPWETPSVAGAFVRFNPQVHQNSEDVLADADRLMYRSKRQMKEDGTSDI